jgi:hypothetical protein
MRARTLVCLLFAVVAFTNARAFDVPDTALEYYHAGFDHYFITSLPNEIAALDNGTLTGWTRTGRAFAVYNTASIGGLSPVCRFYIPPQHGDSHFFSASPAECANIRARILTDPNYSGYVEESAAVFYALLPDLATGACPSVSVPVYRLWNQRADSNHRYTTDPGIKAAMQAKGYVAEGYGPDAVSLCTPAALRVAALSRASGLTSFAAGCDRVPATGTLYVNGDVEPWIAANPVDGNNLIGVWQQDRWSNGGARGIGIAYSRDGGGTWARSNAPLSRCAGAAAGSAADYERNSDPWVTFTPTGVAWQVALAFNSQANADNAIVVSHSTDGGHTWADAVALRADGSTSFNDKESITADPTDARYVYATWDRLTGNNGPAWLARTTNGGTTWEAARVIYDPGINSQTVNNQIVVLPDGTLVDFFTELANVGPQNARLRLIRSSDKGATWSAPITISDLQTVGTVDPDTGTGIRDGSGIGAIAVGANGMLAAAWQDSRFAITHDDIAFARSLDGGLTWSAPIRINGAPQSAALIPAIAVRSDGTIGVTYFDFRENTPDTTTLPTATWIVTSGDGVTWSERRVAPNFDYAKAPQAGGRYFLGDYSGMASTGTTFLSFFGRATDDAANRSDIVLAQTPAAAPGAMVSVGTQSLPPTAQGSAIARAALAAAVRARLPPAVAQRMTPNTDETR